MRGSILVIEDDDAVRETIAEALAEEGLSVRCAAHGLNALHLLRSGLRPDVILLDLMMPVMDGWEFRDEQSRDPGLASIPVVVVTAAYSLERPIRAQAIVRKPFHLDDLLRAIQGQLQLGSIDP